MNVAFCLGFRNWHVRHLQRCLESIRSHTAAPIVLCDLGSHEPEMVLDAAQPYAVTFVRDPQPEWSRSRALNVAARYAPRPATHLVFTDADMLFPGSWFVSADVATLHGPRAVWLTRSRDLGQLPTEKGLLVQWDLCADQFTGAARDNWLLNQSVPHGNDLGQGAAMVVPRDWFERVGGFDEHYWVWGCEDNDLTQRAAWDGVPVRWMPDAWVAHQWHRRDWPTPEQFEQVKRNREYFYQRLADGGPVVRNKEASR